MTLSRSGYLTLSRSGYLTLSRSGYLMDAALKLTLRVRLRASD